MLDTVNALQTSASVHALSGSSRPGAVPPLLPLVTAGRPDAPAAHPDAEVIELAGRVAALARRDHRIWSRRTAIEDRVDAALPGLPVQPERPSRATVREVEADGVRTTIITEPTAPDPAYVAALAAHDAACAERVRLEGEMEVALGYPRWEKLSKRTFARLVRWAGRLGLMRPATREGLQAKVDAWRVIAETGNSGHWTKEFAAAVSRDAARLEGARAASATATMDPFTGYHAEIQRLRALIDATEEGQPEHEQAWARWKEIDDLALSTVPTTLAGAIGALEYARREHHQFEVEGVEDSGGQVGTTERLVLHLIDGALGVLRGVGPAEVAAPRPEPRIAAMYREAKALTALALDPATDGAPSDQAIGKALDLKFAAAREPITTPGAAVAALAWALDEFRGFYVDQPDRPDKMDRWTAAMMESALGVLRSVAGQGTARQGDLRPVPLPAGLSALRLGPTDRREWYRSWLYGELRMLNLELDGKPEISAIWQNNPGADFHFPREADWRDVPKPSTRAAAVLELLGILPTDGTDAVPSPAASAA